MGGGPVQRALAGVGSLGLSELTQKKPFQDFHTDNPTSSATGGPLRFIPGGSQIAGIMDLAQNEMTPEAPTPHTLPVLGTEKTDDPAADNAKRKLDAAAEKERLRAGRGKASTMITSPDDQAITGPRLKKFLGGY
jgi:hypothetical protein